MGEDFELKVLNGNELNILRKSEEKYTIIKASAQKHSEFHM